jgi:NAD(P)H-dependent FMN reductase
MNDTFANIPGAARPKLHVIVASTRPGRRGLPIGQWAFDHAVEHGGFDVELVDLAEVALPFLDEPSHPRLRKYTHQHTKDWSAKIDAADAFVFVTPEYNYGMTAPLKNAIDYLHYEWQYKPVGFVSYGGLAGGTRAVQMLKQVVTALKMVPLVEAVPIPFFAQFFDDEDQFRPNEGLETSLTAMLNEMLRVESALRPLRTPAMLGTEKPATSVALAASPGAVAPTPAT